MHVRSSVIRIWADRRRQLEDPFLVNTESRRYSLKRSRTQRYCVDILSANDEPVWSQMLKDEYRWGSKEMQNLGLGQKGPRNMRVVLQGG